jgi:flagellar motor protein MotB
MSSNGLNILDELEDPKKSNGNAWLISLADLISLILSFFVLMYSTKDIPPQKYKEIKESFSNYLNGEKPENNYKFVNKINQNTKIVKQAGKLTYLEPVLKNSFNENGDTSMNLVATDNSIKIEFELDYKTKKELSAKLTEKVTILSKTLNSLSNQIEVSVSASNLDSSARINEILAKKLEEFGYEYKIFRTLPDKIFTENIENNKNKVNISIIINSYESIF